MPGYPDRTGRGRGSRRYHMIVDVYDHPCERMTSTELSALLTRLPELIHMRVLAGPVVVDGVPENPGLSGFVIIDYSHISAHTFSLHDELMFDVFSCKPYSRGDVVRFLAETLGTDESHMDVRIVSWG